MAGQTSLRYNKNYCTALSFKIAVAFFTPLLFIFSYIHYDTLRISNWIRYGTDTTRKSATDNTSRIDHLEDFETRCNPNDLHQLSVLEEGGSSNGVRLVKMSKAAILCPRQLKKLESEYQRTWLLSYPGSGNTWTRHLLQQLTGHYTGSVYNDSELMANGFPYEGRWENVVAIKTHTVERIHEQAKIKLTFTTDRIILVIRNPYKSFLAEYKRGPMKLGHVGNAQVITSKKWDKYIMLSADKWEKFIREMIDLKYGKLIMFYEDLTSELLRQLVRLANFIGTEDLNEFSFCCVLKKREGDNHRGKSNQTVDGLYSKSNKVVINAMLTKLTKSIEKTHPKTAKKLLSYIKPM